MGREEAEGLVCMFAGAAKTFMYSRVRVVYNEISFNRDVLKCVPTIGHSCVEPKIYLAGCLIQDYTI